MSTVADFHLPGDDTVALDQNDLDRLTHYLAKYAPHDEGFELIKDGVKVFRESKPGLKKTFMLSQPSICIVPQGAKSVTLAGSSFEYDQSKMVVYAAEVPINVCITKASKENPYYCLVIPIDPTQLSNLNLKVFPNGLPKAEKTRAVYVGDTNPKILKSAIRLMELIEQQEDVDLLSPLIIDEMLIRLLRSPVGSAIAQIGMTDSHAGKVSKAISWLSQNYTEPVKMEDLAYIAGMSVSSFYTHFKSMTDISPLQFQKILRLQEARNLIQTQMMDITSVAFAVGYSSPTQFSREYSREFGVTPSKDQLGGRN